MQLVLISLANQIVVAESVVHPNPLAGFKVDNHPNPKPSPRPYRQGTVGIRDPAAERLAVLESMQLLDVSDESRALGRALLLARAMPSEAIQDAAHIAVAVAHGVDFLATWNFRHIANPTKMPQIEQVCRDAGYDPITICTPRQLMEA